MIGVEENQRRFLTVFFLVDAVARFLAGALLLPAGFSASGWLCLVFGCTSLGFHLLGRKCDVSLLIVGLGLTWSLFFVGQIRFYGWEAGFQQQTGFLVFAVFLFEHLPLRARLLMALSPLPIIVLVKYSVTLWPPVYVLPEVTLNYISLGNLLYAILTSSSILLYFAVTADRRQRLLTAELASRKQMIADLSHEMKTPIAAMLARTQLEIMNREPEPQASRVAGATPWAVIERNLQAMRRLANRMLDLTRLEGGHRVVEPREVDAGEIARQAVEVVRPLADEKNLRLELEMPDAAQAKVVADPDLLSTVLRNLLSNAVRHSRDGGRVLIRGSREQGEHAAPQGFLLEVRDEGEGIAPEILPHIFDPFYRGDAGRSREKGHHGLGLSIARRAVEQMGGQISASSVPGEGATFFVRL